MLGEVLIVLEKFLELAIDEVVENIKDRWLRTMIEKYKQDKNAIYEE